MFTDSFGKGDFSLTKIQFELHNGAEISSEYPDYNLTLGQFVDKVRALPKLSSTKSPGIYVDVNLSCAR